MEVRFTEDTGIRPPPLAPPPSERGITRTIRITRTTGTSRTTRTLNPLTYSPINAQIITKVAASDSRMSVVASLKVLICQ
jgi:hypothetical protein